jgi:hypothetical protein
MGVKRGSDRESETTHVCWPNPVQDASVIPPKSIANKLACLQNPVRESNACFAATADGNHRRRVAEGGIEPLRLWKAPTEDAHDHWASQACFDPRTGSASGEPEVTFEAFAVVPVVGLVSIGGDKVSAAPGRKLNDGPRRLGCG